MSAGRVALVTGAGGFIGGRVVERLLADGFTVRAAWRRRRPTLRAGMTAVQLELARGAPPGELLRGADVVIHLAARAHVVRDTGRDAEAEFHRENASATARLASVASRNGVRRFVFLSTVGVHGDRTSPGVALTDAAALAPRSPYARSKLAAEQLLRNAGDDCPPELVIVRPPLVYGPGAPGNLARLLAAVRRGIPLPFGRVQNRRSLVGVESLADLLALACSEAAAAGRAFVVADRRPVSTAQIITAIAEGAGCRARLVPLSPAVLRLASRLTGRRTPFTSLCESLVVDPRAAQDLLGWNPAPDPLEGLRLAAAASP